MPKTFDAPFEVLPTMAGEVKFYKRVCPFGERFMDKEVMIGSSSCMICRYYETREIHMNELGEVIAEGITCNNQ